MTSMHPIRPSRGRKKNTPLTLTRLILQQLAELGEVGVSSFFPAKYPQVRIWRSLLNLDPKHQFRRETFWALLSRLQSQGLVERSPASRKTWRLTKKGRDLFTTTPNPEPVPTDGIGRLVIFDIPEDQRKKRHAIRAELVVAGFTPLQKSVWYGERPLPEEFLKMIDTLELQDNIHIFSVRERGTIPKQY